jgi:hypothetical protein
MKIDNILVNYLKELIGFELNNLRVLLTNKDPLKEYLIKWKRKWINL